MSILTGYESAGVSYVNGQRVNSENNANPYANANAPPMPAVPSYPSSDSEHHRSSSGSNLGYPPYPSNTGTSGHGYPQSTNQAGRQDLGYPPYPTQNRMPTPGQSAYPSYPQNSGYPQAPVNPQYPGYQNYPYQNYPNQRGYNYNSNSMYGRKNAASIEVVASMILVGFSGLFLLVMIRW